MATYNFLDKTGLGLVWAKIKALVVQSDWEESDTTDSAFIQNKPSVRAGTGTDSVVINGDDDSNCAIYTLYITQTQADVLAGKKYYTYTTEDTLPSTSNLINRGIFYFDNTDASGEVAWSKIKSIDTTNHTIEVYNRATGGFPTNKEAKIYYKYKLAIGEESLAEGSLTSAIGYQSHAEGNSSNASGSSSHAEGIMTSAIGSSSHTEGNRTIAASSYQHVQGKYNIEDADGTYAHIVGNGSSSARSNAHTLDWSGNAWFAGKVTVGTAPTNDLDVATKKYVDDSIPTVPDDLSDLTDVAISSATNGQVLTYNSTSSKWENSNAVNTTYSISMSSNVITLTGSDGTTSSVTLPVYDGTVSNGGGS